MQLACLARPVAATVLGIAVAMAGIAPAAAGGLFRSDKAVPGNWFDAAVLEAPTGLAVAWDGQWPTLVWEPSPSTFATGYLIERADHPDGPWGVVGSVAGSDATSFVDETAAAGDVSFRVRAIAHNWLSGTISGDASSPARLLADNFNRPDLLGLGGLGSTSTGGVAWQVLRGSWGTDGFKASTLTSNALHPAAVVEGRTANVDLSLDIDSGLLGGGDSIVFRAVDANDYLRVRYQHEGLIIGYSNHLHLERVRNGSTVTNLASVSLGGAATGAANSIRVVANGTSISVYRNGGATPVLTAVSAVNESATKHGIGRGPSGLSGSNIDNFVMAPL